MVQKSGAGQMVERHGTNLHQDLSTPETCPSAGVDPHHHCFPICLSIAARRIIETAAVRVSKHLVAVLAGKIEGVIDNRLQIESLGAAPHSRRRDDHLCSARPPDNTSLALSVQHKGLRFCCKLWL